MEEKQVCESGTIWQSTKNSKADSDNFVKHSEQNADQQDWHPEEQNFEESSRYSLELKPSNSSAKTEIEEYIPNSRDFSKQVVRSPKKRGRPRKDQLCVPKAEVPDYICEFADCLIRVGLPLERMRKLLSSIPCYQPFIVDGQNSAKLEIPPPSEEFSAENASSGGWTMVKNSLLKELEDKEKATAKKFPGKPANQTLLDQFVADISRATKQHISKERIEPWVQAELKGCPVISTMIEETQKLVEELQKAETDLQSSTIGSKSDHDLIDLFEKLGGKHTTRLAKLRACWIKFSQILQVNFIDQKESALSNENASDVCKKLHSNIRDLIGSIVAITGEPKFINYPTDFNAEQKATYFHQKRMSIKPGKLVFISEPQQEAAADNASKIALAEATSPTTGPTAAWRINSSGSNLGKRNPSEIRGSQDGARPQKFRKTAMQTVDRVAEAKPHELQNLKKRPLLSISAERQPCFGEYDIPDKSVSTKICPASPSLSNPVEQTMSAQNEGVCPRYQQKFEEIAGPWHSVHDNLDGELERYPEFAAEFADEDFPN